MCLFNICNTHKLFKVKLATRKRRLGMELNFHVQLVFKLFSPFCTASLIERILISTGTSISSLSVFSYFYLVCL